MTPEFLQGLDEFWKDTVSWSNNVPYIEQVVMLRTCLVKMYLDIAIER